MKKTPFVFLQSIISCFLGDEQLEKIEKNAKTFLYAFQGKSKKEIALAEEVERQKIILEAQQKAKEELGLDK